MIMANYSEHPPQNSRIYLGENRVIVSFVIASY